MDDAATAARMRSHRGTCRGCDAPVVFGWTTEEKLVVLDVHESAAGAGRYAIGEDGFARLVKSDVDMRAHELHACDALLSHRQAALT